jgi:hypothetical protein
VTSWPTRSALPICTSSRRAPAVRARAAGPPRRPRRRTPRGSRPSARSAPRPGSWRPAGPRSRSRSRLGSRARTERSRNRRSRTFSGAPRSPALSSRALLKRG